MATYYCGSGGSNANTGLSWAQRKLTLNGVEDIPVVAGDVAYIGPGVYRELLTCDVSGSGGSPITYIADTTGQNTDGVGGIVRITGSDNDQTAARANCIVAVGRTHRTFRGFTFDTCSSGHISATSSPTNWIIEDCYFGPGLGSNVVAIDIAGASQASNTIRRCVIVAPGGATAVGIRFTHTTTVDNTSHLVENCALIGGGSNFAQGVQMVRVGGGTIKNCLLIGWQSQIDVGTALSIGQTWNVNNCLMTGARFGFRATASGEITENYNTLTNFDTARTNTSTGANSNTYPPLLNPLLLLSGFHLSQFAPWSLSEWSQVRAITGTGTPTDGLYGQTRPATAAKTSWGPVQWVDAKRETSTVRTGTASLKLADAGLVRVRRVWHDGASTTISLYVRWEADYAGTKPRMVIKQPGQSDRTTTATGLSGAWEQLSDTFTPAALPGWVDVFVESSNTAAAGAYGCFVDDLAVS